GERYLHECRLLPPVRMSGARGRTGALRSGHRHDVALAQDLLKARADVIERPHVSRLLLDPDDFGGAPMGEERLLEIALGKRIELLEAHDRDAGGVPFIPLRLELVGDLS